LTLILDKKLFLFPWLRFSVVVAAEISSLICVELELVLSQVNELFGDSPESSNSVELVSGSRWYMTAQDPLIVDAHEDLALNALSYERDLLRPAVERRMTEPKDDERGGATSSFPDLIQGNVRIVFGTLWVNPRGSPFGMKPWYSNSEEAHDQAMMQLDYYNRLEREGVISIIRNKSMLEDVVNSHDSRLGLVVLMEGADPIKTPSEVKMWFDKGLRIVGPAWGKTRYAGGTKAPGPLTKEGHDLLRELERHGLILDCTHFAEESYLEALDEFDGDVIASHSNCRIYCPTDRHLTDEMIRKLASRGGVIGTVLYNGFLDGKWQKGNPKNEVTLSQVVKNIVHVCEISGSFGYESIPKELDTSADLYKIGEALRIEANFSDNEVEDVMGGNFLRILRKVLPD
jgi:membrane dipeptidase